MACEDFSEDITSAKAVQGWKKLSSLDFKTLVSRIEESKVDIEKENEELQPDELVPVAFQGPLREPPVGLVGNLLPFQVEGVSWMHDQEVNKAIHGGILADEMVRVTWILCVMKLKWLTGCVVATREWARPFRLLPPF